MLGIIHSWIWDLSHRSFFVLAFCSGDLKSEFFSYLVEKKKGQKKERKKDKILCCHKHEGRSFNKGYHFCGQCDWKTHIFLVQESILQYFMIQVRPLKASYDLNPDSSLTTMPEFMIKFEKK